MKNILIILLILFSLIACKHYKKPENQFIGSTWVNNLFENCTDTLKVMSESEMIFYSCEHGFHNQANYSIESEIISVDYYDFLEDHETIGLYSKYKMKKEGNKLKYIFISHLYGGEFKEVDKKIYETCGEFIRIK